MRWHQLIPLTNSTNEAFSPTVTRVSSRSQTPSHLDLQDEPTPASSRHSQSPSRPRSPSAEPFKMVGGHGRDHEDKVSVQQRPAMAPSISAPVGKIPRLLHDRSQYTDSYVPSAAVTASSTTLAELAHVVRLQSYHEQRRAQLRVRLNRWLVASGLSARLARCGELARRTALAESFRSDDKKGFANLYNAIHDVRNSCDATRQYALLEPNLISGRSPVSPADRKSAIGFMQEIPSKVRDTFLHFLTEIRTNPEFVAGRIASLSTSELGALTDFHQTEGLIETVMGGPGKSRGKTLGANSNRTTSHIPTPVERLLSFQRHDPLSALLYNVFANSSGPDSAEDLRRTEVWSTACARLIVESKVGGEAFVGTVLNSWAAMREWPGRANLELYLMKILQDGAFLLETAEDSTASSRNPVEFRSGNSKDDILAVEFYDRAVKRLFEVIDDEPSAGGIPEGVLELGHAIFKKLEEPKKQRAAQTFIVSRWFFSNFLLNAIIHPESQGMMTGHHITEFARQKILKQIAIRAQKHVLDVTSNLKQSASVLPEIRAHIDKIILRFKNPRSHGSRPVLLPARAITSPRETVEVQPFLVLCPSDIVTLVNTLFPEHRPASDSLEKGIHIKGLQSAASSISGLSLSMQTPASRTGLDSASQLSQSGSSMTSDVTSREPLLDGADGRSTATSFSSREFASLGSKAISMETFGQELRESIAAMSRELGSDATRGTCHPCAEKWAVLYVSADGKDLLTRMRKDWDDDDDEEDDSPDSDSEDEGPSDKIDLSKEYHLLKEAIIKLVEEYEIPKELAPESESKEFSNRASTIQRRAQRVANQRTQAASEVTRSNNPYHSSQSQLTSMLAPQREAVPERHRHHQHARSSSAHEYRLQEIREQPSVLLTMLETAFTQCQARAEYTSAHSYYITLIRLQHLSSESLKQNGYAPLLNYFSRGPRDSLGKASGAIEEFEAWFVWLKQSQERHDAAIEEMMQGLNHLRDKMWYVRDVKNSAPYEEAKNVAKALKAMGRTPTSKLQPETRSRPTSKPTSNSFLRQTEAQIVNLMTASEEQGGPYKLSDEQTEMTVKYLSQYGVENFCKGEERIHRFCLEIDKCVNKIVGNDMIDGPVLWSSELYFRDKRILDSGRQKGDLFLTGVGTLSIAGDEEYETDAVKSNYTSSTATSRPGSQGLRAISTLNGSQQSFDSGKWSTARGSAMTDGSELHDQFGPLSPVLNIDSTKTFWSPFQTEVQMQSNDSSIRPRTASSTNETVMLKYSHSVNRDKRGFLLALKQTLTGLLLSELGNMVWSTGSETDIWFSGPLGEECIQRKEEQDRRRKKLAKKRSMKSLRNVKTDVRSLAAEPATNMAHTGPGAHSAEETSSSSDATARSSGLSVATRNGLFEFPYNIAFQRLLNRFSTHPNPFWKLDALYELEMLIIARLSSRSGKPFGSRKDALPAAPPSPTLAAMGHLSSREPGVQVSRAKNLDEQIANCEERRTSTMRHYASPSRGGGTRSPYASASQDMVVEVLQGLFRDANIRPKGLFRDLQFVASFVPASILDKTERGKAFWDAGLAALGLKQSVCHTMVEMADEIVANTIKNRGQPSTKRTSSSDEIAHRSMENAAEMLTITAKEGDPAAERELATFYLTQPDLLRRTIQPLSRPKDTFKAHGMMQRNEDPSRLDPATMCVAFHWMELSAHGGDDLASKYLRDRAGLDAIP